MVADPGFISGTINEPRMNVLPRLGVFVKNHTRTLHEMWRGRLAVMRVNNGRPRLGGFRTHSVSGEPPAEENPRGGLVPETREC